MASKIVEAVKNLYQKTVQANEQAAKANMAVQREETKKVTNAAKKVYSNLQQQQESAARSQVQQDRAKTQQAKATSTKVQTAVKNLYQQAAAQQQRAVQADMSVRRAENQRVQNAVQGLYSAYQRQQEQQTISQIRQAQEERAAAQRLYSGIRDAAATGQRSAAQADMSVQQTQSQRLQNALRDIYNASTRQAEQQFAVQRELNEQRVFQPGRLQSIGEAALTGTAAGYAGTGRALYESGQTARDTQNRELLDEYARGLERAKSDYEYYLEQAGGNVNDPDVVSQQYIIDDWQRKYDAMAKVVNEQVQQRATEATTQLTQQLEKQSQEATERAKEGTNAVGSFAVDAAINMMEMTMDSVAGVATGDTLIPMALRVFGQSASQAQQRGADIGDQLAYGAAVAGIEVFTEKMFDGLAGLYGKGAADEITEELIRKLAKSAAGRSALRLIIGMNEEGIEEVVSDVLSPVAELILDYDRSKNPLENLVGSYQKNFDISDTLYNYLIGAAVAGGMNVARPVSAIRSNVEANAELAQADAEEQSRRSGVQTEETPETVRATAPGNEGLRSEFADRVAEETEQDIQIAPERQAAMDQAVQDIRAASQENFNIDTDAAFIGPNGDPVAWDMRDQNHDRLLGEGDWSDRYGTRQAIADGYIRVKQGEGVELALDNGVLSPQQAQAIRKLVDGFTGKSFNIDFDITDDSGLASHYGSLTINAEDLDGRSTVDRINREIRRFEQGAQQTQQMQGVPAPFTPITAQTQQEIEREISPEDIQGEAVNRNRTAEESMTMDQARRMIEMVFNEYVQQEGQYRTAEEWAQNADVGDVAMLLENSENAVEQYLNKIPELWDDFDVEDIVKAYRAGTLTGDVKQSPVRMNTSLDTGRQDDRFYAPRIVNSSSETWDLANQRVTNENREAVYQARKDLLFFAHQPGAAEELGITQKELNARLRSWSNYSANGRAVSQRINEGVAPENQWYGIQNCSAVSKATITDADIESMVKAVEGESDDYRRNYVGRTMLALDTHIDWSGLTIRFLKGQADPNDRSVRGSYDNSNQTVTVGGSGDSNTVAHEMGHALDGLWGRQIFGGGYLSQKLNGDSLESPEARQFFNNFKLFIDSLNEKSDIRSSYTGRNTEVFARFIARFVEWADRIAGNRFYSEANYYKDGFTQAQFVEFAKLLQEKSALEAVIQNAVHDGGIEDVGPMADIDIPRDYIAYGDLSTESKKTKEAIQRLREKGQYVNLSYKDLEGLPEAIEGENYKAKSREVFRRILKTFLGKDLELRFDGNSAIVYLSSSGLDHAVVANYSQFKAATFTKLRRLLRNTEYAFSTKHDTEHRGNLKAEDADWDTFVSLARLDGEELPVIFRIKSSDREVRGNLYDIIANENLQYKEDGSTRDAGQGDLGKSSSYGGTPSSNNNIADTSNESNPQNKVSVEVPGENIQEARRALQRPVLRTNPQVVFGNSGKTYTNTDTIEFQYAIVPLEDLLTSHDRHGNINPEYPAELQPRDRTRATSQGDIDRMARTLNPDLLADSKTAQNGAPIVTDTGIVISGNGRTAAIQAAYESGNSETYQQYLREHAAEFGIDPRAIPENPVLVRVAKGSGNAAQLARDLNVTTTAAMSATETAQVDADKLSEIMDSVVFDEDADLTAASNRGFMQRFIEEIVPESERGSMYDANGNLSKAGLTRIQNAIFATAYGDESRLARMAEYTDDTAKNITKALVNASNSALQLQSGVKNGTSYDVDVTGAIMRALDLYEQSRAEGKSFEDFMAQYRMDDVDGTAWDIAQFIAAHKRSAKAIGEYFVSLYDAAMDHDPNQISMFGGEENGPTAEDILREGESRYLGKADGNFLGYDPEERKEAGVSVREELPDRRSNSEGALAGRALGVSESGTEAQRESDWIDGDLAADLTEGGKSAPAAGTPEGPEGSEGGEKPIYNDGTFPASDLFGPTNEARESAAVDKATKAGNDELNKYIEDLPDDPMDLYKKRQKVTPEMKGEDRITTKKAPQRKTLGQKISEGWHGFLRLMVNDADAIHQAGRQTGNKALDGMYFYAKAASQRAQQWIQGKRMSFDLKNSGDGLNTIFDPIRAKGEQYYKDFQLYMYHMLNVERMSRNTGNDIAVAKETLEQLASANPWLGSMTDDELQRRARQYREGGGLGYSENEQQGEMIAEYWEAKKELMRAERQQNKPVFGFGEDSPDADKSKKIADDLLAAHPEFEQEAQKVYDYIDDLLQYRVDSGLITQEDMENLKSIYPHYVPVLYDYENAPQDIRKGGLTVSSTIKKTKGGDTTLLPLHYALARQTLTVMRNSGYEQLGSAMLNEYENNEELMGKWVQNVEESEAAWDPSMADNEVPQIKENVIPVFRDGKRYDMTLSPDMAYAFNSLQASAQEKVLGKMVGGANDLFKKLCTAYNPLFTVSNFTRDLQDALFYSTDMKRWIKNYPKAYAQIAGNGKYWQMYQGMGGVYNSYFDWATGEAAEKGGKMNKVEMLNLWIEQAPRLAEFMTTLENAERDHNNVTQEDLMEAFNNAAEVTTNFSRSGKVGRFINRYMVPFWNPGVQGLSKVTRTVTETKGFKAWAGLTLKAAALGMLPAVLNGLLYRDDDEWDVIDDSMKQDYYLFKGKDGVWIKIPKGRVLAALSTPVVGLMESVRGDEVDWAQLWKNAFGSVAPNNPIESTLFSTALRADLFDPDSPGKTWYGGDIESKRLQNYAPGERYDESTDAISKWLGGKLDLSPKKLSYILDQYSGVLGDLILPYLTPKAERGIYAGDYAIPMSNAFMSRFTMDTVTSNTISSEYYGLLDQLTWKANSGDDAAAMAKKYMSRAGGTVADFYAKIREIENDKNLTDKEKTTLTRELRKQLNEYQQQVTADAQAYLETAQQYIDEHPESDFTDDGAVDAFVEGYNSTQTSENDMITADEAAKKMQDEVYREANRQHFGAEYALQAYNTEVYGKAQELNEESGLSYDDFYDYYFATRNMRSDRDEDGKTISGSKKQKVVGYIDGMDISEDQKDALYLAAGYSESTLEDAPWNGGSGVYTGSSSGSGRKKTPAARLNEYQEVQAKKAADPNYNAAADGHAWTVWADRAQEAGIGIEDAIQHMTALSQFKADYDEYGKAITGSKKQKVCDYIDGLDLTNAQKDVLYLYVYNQNSLRYTPWHGYTEGKKSGRRGGRRGGGRRKRAASTKPIKPVQVGQLAGGYNTGVDIRPLFGGSTGKTASSTAGSTARIAGIKSSTSGTGKKNSTSAGLDLLNIVNQYYDGNPLAAAMDGGRKARTKVDFKL